MKKTKKINILPVFIFILIVALTGCGSGNETTAVTGETEGIVFMETKVQEGEEGSLFYIPNKTAESMKNPDLYLVQNNLLFVDSPMENSKREVCLNMISLEDGELLAKNQYAVKGELKIQTGEGMIALIDREAGNILFLDHELKVMKEYKTEKEYLDLYLSSDMENLYLFETEGKILRRNLAADEEQVILDQMEETEILGYYNYSVLFSYVDKENRGKKCLMLSLDESNLSETPITWQAEEGCKSGENYFLKDEGGQGRYTLITKDLIKQIECNEGSMKYIGNKQHLLFIEEDNHGLHLYDVNGGYVSGGQFDGEEELCLSDQFVFSGYRQGYYFMATTKDGSKLMFWDPSVKTEGENLSFAKVEERESELDFNVLKKRAEELSEDYDVEILIGEDCSLDYPSYEASALLDGLSISRVLDTMERCLSRYPKGFLKQLQTDTIEVLRFELVSKLSLKEGITSRIESSGIAQEMQDHFLIVLNVEFLTDSLVYHEKAHAIDSHVISASYGREGAVFQEDTWLKLQPEGFAYAQSYVDIPDSVKKFYDSGYFATEYACTFPTEDKATMMENAMIGDTFLFEDNPGLKEKMIYFSKCIRDSFDTTGWPEQTEWERVLE